jgi:hypothetical protein
MQFFKLPQIDFISVPTNNNNNNNNKKDKKVKLSFKKIVEEDENNSLADDHSLSFPHDGLVDSNNAKPEVRTPYAEWNVKEILSESLLSENFDTFSVQSSYIFAFKKSLVWYQNTNIIDPPTPLDNKSNSASVDIPRECENGIIIFPRNMNRIYVFGLKVIALPKSATAHSGADNNPSTYILQLINYWDTCSPITSYSFDSDARSVLLLGLQNGSMIMYHLRSLLMNIVPVKHATAITSIAINDSTSGHVIISGAYDGTLCFCNIHCSKPGTPTAASPFITASLVGFREDFPDPIVKIWSIQNISLIVVLNSSGYYLVYDTETFQLLGRLSLTSGIPGLKLEYYPATIGNMKNNSTFEAASGNDNMRN